MNRAVDNSSKNNLTRQKDFYEKLIRIIEYKTKFSDDYIRYLLEQILEQTGSMKGFVFMLTKSVWSVKLCFKIDSTGSKKFDDEIVNAKDEDVAALLTKDAGLENIVVVNSESSVYSLNDDEKKKVVVSRYCAVPIVVAGKTRYLLIIADKETDYLDYDEEFLKLLKGPASSIVENLLNSEDLIKDKEKAEQNEQRTISYLTNIAHEIKTPVNAITGFSGLLKESNALTKTHQKFLDIILESCNNLISIVNSVVEITNFESGLITIVRKEFSITELISEVYETCMEETAERKLLFRTEVSISESDSFLVADREKVKQVLLTLLSNSLRFTYTGEIVFGCKLKEGFMEFFVSDTGTGIADENKHLVFNHFFQAGESLSKSFKGTGLGLTLSKGYVEKMGGQIWFISTEGKGSEFYFTVPFKQSIHLPSDNEQKDTIKTQEVNRKKVVLVAEDDHLNFLLIKNFLSKHNVEILRAENGKEAVFICREKKIDLVLMDIRMPVMDGYTATRLIKDSNPDQIVIAQTAYTNDRNTALSNGCTDFIAKPFGKQQLISLLDSYL